MFSGAGISTSTILLDHEENQRGVMMHLTKERAEWRVGRSWFPDSKRQYVRSLRFSNIENPSYYYGTPLTALFQKMHCLRRQLKRRTNARNEGKKLEARSNRHIVQTEAIGTRPPKNRA